MATILGIGVDMVDIPRIAAMRERHEERLRTIFLQSELDCCLTRANPDECLAARFAAKEAVMKALGTGWAEGVAFNGIEVFRQESGKPEIRLHGGASEKAIALGAGKIHVSLSHASSSAIAYVIVESALSAF